ncbi:MAG: N-acetylmuramoyl-L-alanine amidase, partial [Ilumatobacter sp.]|nr:N-acetylmuramoyl-L-alanine amidase [Ilumatobacter sp.]
MCDHEPTRRQLLVGAAVGTAALLTGARPATAAYPPPVAPVEVMPGLFIHPRAHWGGDLPPKRPTVLEDSRFLLVHHTASSNTYADPRDVMRVTYWWHTSSDPSKGWPDVCYQFFIGRDGDVYEGRAGALTHPVVADATGGNQGFAQLICLLGD